MSNKTEQDLIPASRAEQVVQQNSDALMRLCAEHSITLQTATAHLWRPTQRSRGDIPGVAQGLNILCTDGIVAWFINDLGVLLYGHIQCFDGKVISLHGKHKLRKSGQFAGPKPKPKQTPKQTAEQLMEQLLAECRAVAQPQPQRQQISDE